MIIAVDFDGTLCEHKYPEIGEAYLRIINALIRCKKRGDKLILWSCRTGKELEEAIEWCKKLGLEFDETNNDLPEIKNSWFGKVKSCKVNADVYLDDRNISIKEFLEKELYNDICI